MNPAQPPRYPRMAGERPVLGLRQFEPLASTSRPKSQPPRRRGHRRPEWCRPIPSNCGLAGSFYNPMTVRTQILRIFDQEDINFLLTNRIPRRLATQFIGWFSQIEQPLVRDVSIALWRLFSDLDLSEAKKTAFRSLHDCFIRELKDGARPIDRDRRNPGQPVRRDCRRLRRDRRHRPLSSQGLSLHAARPAVRSGARRAHRNGRYVTLRLKSSMYHRFHAPYDCRIDQVPTFPAIPGTSIRSRSSASSGCSARTNARCCGLRWRRAAHPWRWWRLPRSSSPASACTVSMTLLNLNYRGPQCHRLRRLIQ